MSIINAFPSNPGLATTTRDGLLSKADKKKLDSISEGATSYTHPDTHPASIIVEDSTHRFVTDTEKSTWNAKASTAVASTTANGLMSSTDKTNLNSLLTRVSTLETNYNAMLAKLKTAVFINQE